MQTTKHLSRCIFAATGLGATLALGLGSAQAQQPTTQQSEMQQSMPRGGPHMGASEPGMKQRAPGMGQRDNRSRRWDNDRPQPMPELTIRDIYDRVEAAGYRDLREIELKDSHYKVKAVDSDGQPVKLCVNASSGEMERIRRKTPDRPRADDRSSRSGAGRVDDSSREQATRPQPAATDYYDYAMQPVANNAAAGENAWGWRYFSDPNAYRAVVISPAGDYYLSSGRGLRWIAGTQMKS